MTAEDYGLARRMWHQLEPVPWQISGSICV
jgi:hypothetical protein